MNLRLRHPWLICLLVVLLTAAQAVKESPWHDHEHHVVDCALCHVQTGADAVPAAPPDPAPGGLAVRSTAAVPSTPFPARVSPYQGRAPPLPL